MAIDICAQEPTIYRERLGWLKLNPSVPFNSRGIARPANQTFDDVFNERLPLYEQYAGLSCTNISSDITPLIHILRRHLNK